MYGFDNVDLSDHEFAKWLRDHDAVNNYRRSGKSVSWRRKEDDKVVAVAIYDNSACQRSIWLAKDI